MTLRPVDVLVAVLIAVACLVAAPWPARRRGRRVPITVRAIQKWHALLSGPSAGGRGVSSARHRTPQRIERPISGAATAPDADAPGPSAARLDTPPAGLPGSSPASPRPAHRPACPACLPIDLERSTPGQPPYVCARTLVEHRDPCGAGR